MPNVRFPFKMKATATCTVTHKQPEEKPAETKED